MAYSMEDVLRRERALGTIGVAHLVVTEVKCTRKFKHFRVAYGQSRGRGEGVHKEYWPFCSGGGVVVLYVLWLVRELTRARMCRRAGVVCGEGGDAHLEGRSVSYRHPQAQVSSFVFFVFFTSINSSK